MKKLLLVMFNALIVLALSTPVLAEPMVAGNSQELAGQPSAMMQKPAAHKHHKNCKHKKHHKMKKAEVKKAAPAAVPAAPAVAK